MISIFPCEYDKILEDPSWVPNEFLFNDHINGFDVNLQNKILQRLNDFAGQKNKSFDIFIHQILSDNITVKYPNLKIRFSIEDQERINTGHFYDYTIHPEINYKNFICSFNGSPHVSRKLLVSCLHKFGWDHTQYCSKNFSFSTAVIDGHLDDYVLDNISFCRKFFISEDSEDFFQSINTFGHVRFEHKQNIYNLEYKLTESFLHLVSETMATSYYPFVTEKFLYSIVTRGLFLAYAQPGWHDHVEKYYGFKRYTKLFDYRFDTIQNPVKRLIELMSMISKFSMLTTSEWQDLYLLEQDTIEYNYNHYFSGKYLDHLKRHE